MDRIPLFEILNTTDNEVILGEDDRHLDFRVSLLRSKENGNTNLTVTTLVRMHNQVGWIYFTFIRPFHRYLVPAIMKKAFREK